MCINFAFCDICVKYIIIDMQIRINIYASLADNIHDAEAMKYIRNRVDINYQDSDMYTPLISATLSKNIDVVSYLISNNVNLNLQDLNGNTALMTSILTSNDDISYLLYMHGANKYMINNKNLTAISIAIIYNNHPIALLLLSRTNNNIVLNDRYVKQYAQLISLAYNNGVMDECAICLEELHFNYRLLKCNHIFHTNCVYNLHKCPLCRRTI
jgi:ankyrin repeat protein